MQLENKKIELEKERQRRINESIQIKDKYIKIIDRTNGDITYSFSDKEIRFVYNSNNKKPSEKIDVSYSLYKPFIDEKELYYGLFSYENESWYQPNGTIEETDTINKNVIKRLYDYLVDLDKRKRCKFRTELDSYVGEYNVSLEQAIPNLLNLISKECIQSIEGYLALRYGIFESKKSFLQNYYIVIKNGETIRKYKRLISNEKYYIDSFYINFFRNVEEERYDSLRAFLIEYAPKDEDCDGFEKAKNRYFEKNRKDNNTFISMVETCISTFMDFIKVVQNRFSFDFIKARDVSWIVFNYNLMKIYHDKWLEYCVCGDIGERSLEDYIRDCCNEDMLSIENKEAITSFIYYYCYLQNDPIEYPNIQIADKIITLVENSTKDNSLKAMENMLFASPKVSANQLFYTIDDIDLMDGVEFEKLIAKLFRKMGYDAEVTKTSGDQGIDVIAIKNGFKYGIQAKCYSSQVSNSAIQEAVAGKAFYSLNKVIVVTNNYFTKSAIKLAEANNVILWDRTILKEKLMYLN